MTTPMHDLRTWLAAELPDCELAGVTLTVAAPVGSEREVTQRLRFLLPSYVEVRVEPLAGLALGSPLGSPFTPTGD